MLTASHISFGYPSRTARESVHVLRDVSLAVPRGALLGLLGPNGCGKTTLLKMLSGVLTPQQGSVALDGTPFDSLSRRDIARRLAVVPQETHPAFDYSVLEMVLMGRHPFLGAFEFEGPDDLRIAHDALRSTGTAHLIHRPYATLSGGEKQRVVIASALAQSADILLLDEPTASLDLGYQLEVAALLADLQRTRGMTQVIATHDLNLVASLCDSVVMLREGRVLTYGATADVLSAASVRALYGVDADVTFHERAGHMTVVPVGRTR